MGAHCRVLNRITALLFKRLSLTSVLKISIHKMVEPGRPGGKLLEEPGDTWTRKCSSEGDKKWLGLL